MVELINLASVASSRRDYILVLAAAQSSFSEKKFAEAAAQYERARDLAGDARLQFPEFLYVQLANCYLRAENHQQAISCLEQGLLEHPQGVEILCFLGSMYLEHDFPGRNPLLAVDYFSRLKNISPEFRQGCTSIETMLTFALAEARVQ